MTVAPSDLTGLLASGVLTDDGFLDGRLAVLQSARGYRAGHDAVLLGAAVPARRGERILDAGSGAGVAGLCLGARVVEVTLVCLDIDPLQVRLAQENLVRNAVAGVSLAGDLTGPVAALEAAGLESAGFDHVLSNPPYRSADSTTPPSHPDRALAFVRRDALEDWIGRCCIFARPGGTVTLVYPARSLTPLLAALGMHCGDIKIVPLWPRAGEAARRVIVQGRRGRGGPDTLLPGLVLHEADGRPAPAVDDILRGRAGLEGLV